MAVATYDPKFANLTFGPHLVTGYAEDQMLEIEFSSPKYENKVGIDGFLTRIKQNNTSGMIKVSLMATSPSNKVLATMARGELGAAVTTLLSIVGASQVALNADVFPVMMYDSSTGAKFTAPDCWVAKEPTIQKGKDIGVIEWELHFSNGTADFGVFT